MLLVCFLRSHDILLSFSKIKGIKSTLYLHAHLTIGILCKKHFCVTVCQTPVLIKRNTKTYYLGNDCPEELFMVKIDKAYATIEGTILEQQGLSLVLENV